MAKMPKRNKSKDNPYTLHYDDNKNIYTVEFVDNLNVLHSIEITKEVYNAFDTFELEDISQIHKFRSHIEHSELYESTLEKRMVNKSYSITDEVEKTILLEDIKRVINSLPDIQKRRLKKYYFENMTLEEIAQEEKCTKRAVKFSIDIAIEKISKKIKN